LIYYAPFDLALPASTAWPEWVADVPVQSARVAAGEPLCTVLAAAEVADAAYALAQARIAALTQMIINP
jgi:predicted ATP-grasp superfamily ATP-dependent carboligase